VRDARLAVLAAHRAAPGGCRAAAAGPAGAGGGAEAEAGAGGSRRRRRGVLLPLLLGGGAPLPLWLPPRFAAAAADPACSCLPAAYQRSPKTAAAYVDAERGLGVEPPAGWERLDLGDAAQALGFLASWRDPKDPVSTFSLSVASTTDSYFRRFGTAQQLADFREASADFQETIGFGERRVERAGSDQKLYYVEIQAGRETAGRFGKAVEFFAVTEHKGREVRIRATASYLNWPRQKPCIEAAADTLYLF